MNSVRSKLIATAAAALLSAGLVTSPLAQTAEASVKCAGLNSCKGHSDCKTAKSECKGLNSCKGQGWTSAKTAKACTDGGGTVLK